MKQTVILVLLTVIGCQQEQTDPCSYARQVSIDQNCYNGRGVKLTASDYGNNPVGFEWKIVAVNDTSQTIGWTPKDVKIVYQASDTFTVPDSLASGAYSRLIVQVATNCGGTPKYSIATAFDRRRSATDPNCIIWMPKPRQ